MNYYYAAIIDPMYPNIVLCWCVVDASSGKCLGTFPSYDEALRFITKLKNNNAFQEYVEKNAKNMEELFLHLSAETIENALKLTQELIESFQEATAPGL